MPQPGRSFASDGRQLGLAALCLLASSCCASREASLRKALEPYQQAMRAQLAASGRCPATLDELGVPLPPGLTKNGNTLSGHGGRAGYALDASGACSLTFSGFSFCGVCSWQCKEERWSCYH